MAQHNDKTATIISVTSKMRPKAWSMSLEGFKSFCEIAGVVVLFLAFLFGAGALWSANRLNAIQDKALKELKWKVSENEKDAAQLKRDAAVLTKEAEDERTARVELESKVAWRKLDKRTQGDMASRLARFTKEPSLVSYNPQDIEAASFASDIAAALHAAKWDVFDAMSILSMRGGPVPFGTNPQLDTGVRVWSTEDEASRNAAASLVEQLSSRGFDAVMSPEVKGLLGIHPTPTRVVVSVEHKPEGAQGEYKQRAQAAPAK
jgi:hypothetical protein